MDDKVMESILNARVEAIKSFVASLGLTESDFDTDYTLQLEALESGDELMRVYKKECVGEVIINYHVGYVEGKLVSLDGGAAV
jgi:hypothetical protein